MGRKAGFSNTTGLYGVCIGVGSGAAVGDGHATEGLTAVGYNAGGAVTTGDNNTIMGHLAGDVIATGSNNLILGYAAGASSNSVSNEITLGDGNISSLRCQVQTISALSDSRDKTDIIDLPYGLDFINKTRPVQFKWDIRDEHCKEDNPHQGKTRNGFIAQDLLALGNNEQHQLVYEENPDRLEASYGDLIPMLTKAIQELSAKVDELENNKCKCKE